MVEYKETFKKAKYQDVFGDLQAQLCIRKLFQTLLTYFCHMVDVSILPRSYVPTWGSSLTHVLPSISPRCTLHHMIHFHKCSEETVG